MALLQTGIAKSGAVDYTIDQSLRFEDGDSAYLSRTVGTATSHRIGTFSVWIKKTQIGNTEGIFNSYDDGDNRTGFYFEDDDSLDMYGKIGGSAHMDLTSTPIYRDPGAWMHVVYSVDVTQSTAADRVKLYVNGDQVTDFVETTYPAQNTDIPLFDATKMIVGARIDNPGTPGNYFDGYLAEFYYIDGQALTPSSFGETDSTTNQWKPIEYEGTYGNNGFYQKYSSTELAASFTDSSYGYVTDSFTSTGSTTWTCPAGVTSAEILIVAGGGGGGSGPATENEAAGGGGGGGVVHASSYTVVPGVEYDLSIGAGGAGGTGTGTGGGGSNSVFNVNAEGSGSTMTAVGAGGGGGALTSTGRDGADGGSGGGGSYKSKTGGSGTQADSGGGTGYGNNGGDGSAAAAGGGGGAAAAGTNSPGAAGGAGGAGKLFSNFTSYGASGYFAGGGGGGGSSGGAAGSGGGGAGGYNGAGAAGTANTGGGGGGGEESSGGAGGSGVVLVRYEDTAIARHTITAVADATNQRGQPKVITPYGDAHMLGPKQGTSVILYDGTGDYLSIPDSSDWDFGTDNFTIEMWLNTRDSSGYNGGVFSHWTDANNHHEIYLIDNVIYWQCLSGGSHVFSGLAASTVVTPENSWAHYAFVRNSTTFTIYKNGVAEDSTTDSDSLPALTAALEVGRIEGGSQYYTGYIDSYRISDSARYTADFTAPTSAFVNDGNTKLLIQSGTDGSNTFDDLSTPDHTITANGDVRWFGPKVGTGAMVFDGTGDYLSAPASNDFRWRAGDFTMESWVKVNSTGSYVMLGEYVGSGDRWYVMLDYTSKTISIFDVGSGLNVETNAITAMTTNTWQHIAVVRDAGVIEMFLDGVPATLGTDTTPGGTINISTTLTIGQYNSGNYLDGYFDGFRLSSTPRYTADFSGSLPTTVFTDDINTVLLLNGDQISGTGFQDKSTGLAVSEESRMSFDGTGDYLTAPAGSDFAFGTGDFTVEAWVRFNNTEDSSYYQGIFGNVTGTGGGYTGNWGARMDPDSTNLIAWYYGSGTSDKYNFTWEPDDIRWYHVAFSREGTDLKCFIDGTQIGATTTDSTSYVSTVDTCIGSYVDASDANGNLNGYMDEVRISKGIARYTANFTTFGQDGGTIANPTPFTADSYTMLLIHSDWTGGLGADSSGNFNKFDVTNLTAYDQMEDSPTNNFCTWNPIAYYPSIVTGTLAGNTYTEGNLKVTSVPTSGAAWTPAIGSLSVSSGKWYWEYYFISNSGSSGAILGVMNAFTTVFSSPPTTTGYRGSNGNKYIDWVVTAYGDTLATGDIIGLALDLDAETITFYRDNVSQGSVSLGTETKASGSFTPTIAMGDATVWTANFGQDSSFAGAKTSGSASAQDANNIGDFYYTVPTGHKALCTDNLSTPDIADPVEYFTTNIWTGDGSDNRTITTGFDPGLSWIKRRNSTNWHSLSDSVRAADPMPVLYSNDTSAEATDANALAFVSNGYTVDDNAYYNASGGTYVGWTWKAGTTFDPTTDGTITTASGSKNVDSGFSIISYTGTGSAVTVGHGLSQAPELIITKKRSSTAMNKNWFVAATPIGTGNTVLELNTGDAATATPSPAAYDDPHSTPSVIDFETNANVNESGETYIMYCFHSVEGYSKVGSYEGNNDADGPFLYCGFKPAFLIYRSIDTGFDWGMVDNKRSPYNVLTKYLAANEYAAEITNSFGDFTSNGIKIRNTYGGANAANTYMFIAFAETPFKTSNAR